jgi:phage shock protein E
MHKVSIWLFALFMLVTAPAFADAGQARRSDDSLIIDVRTGDEYQRGHVPEALNIPYDEIADRIVTVAPNRRAQIILYCRSGRRAVIAEQTLRELGYIQIENKGGLEDMKNAGYRIE